MNSMTGLSPTEMDAIIAGASRLEERFSGDFLPAEGNLPAAIRRLERWKFLAADGDQARFQQILAAYGIEKVSERELLGLLGPVHRRQGLPQPEWISLLSEIVTAIRVAFTEKTANAGSISQPRGAIPYAELYEPITALAKNKVTSRCALQRTLLDSRAWKGLEKHLLNRLSSICSVALHPKFLAYKAVHESSPSGLFQASGKRLGEASSIYRAFLGHMGKRGLAEFFTQYPAAARLVAEVTLHWIDFASEFLRRLESDLQALAERFNAGQSPGAVAAIQAGVSDSHRGGRSVLILNFAMGLRLVYKPRPMQIDAVFFELIGWLNDCGFDPAFRPLTMLNRSDYGWMEWVRPAPCRSKAAARRFYRRAGSLICLMHVLKGVDFHCENLIAAGEFPLIVDLEALCHPALPVGNGHDDEKGGHLISGSVLQVGLLPLRRKCPDGKMYFDNSALSAPPRQRSIQAAEKWKFINSDQMWLGFHCAWRKKTNHLPRLNDKALRVQDFSHEMMAGFRLMSSFLTNATQSKALTGWITRLERCRARHIKRPTIAYMTLIRSSLHLRVLAEGVDRSIELEVVPIDGDHGQAQREAELSSLEMLDVPYFNREQADIDPKFPSDGLPDAKDLAKQAAILALALRCRLEVRGPKAFEPRKSNRLSNEANRTSMRADSWVCAES